MPIIRPLSKVLVSGANGFIATWVVRNLLEHGYSVRGTVRSSREGEHLKKYFSRYGNKLKIVVVEDIIKVITVLLFYSRTRRTLSLTWIGAGGGV